MPSRLINDVGLRFDELLPVLEDWEFLMRCVAFAPVKDTRKVTSIYQVWRTGESSSTLHGVDLWHATAAFDPGAHESAAASASSGSIEPLVKMCEGIAELEPTREQLEATRYEAASLRNEARRDQKIVAEASALVDEFEKVRNAYQITINSRRWRLLGPPAWVVATARGACRGVMSRVAKLFRHK